MKALSIAATGMNAQQTNLEVIANNIANINTTGYKRARAEFSDLLYQTERAQGVPNRANQAIVPEGAIIGLGVRRPPCATCTSRACLTSTGNESRPRAGRQAAGSRSRRRTARRSIPAPAPSTRMPTGQLVTIDG
jgi:flagellar basal-body rod protein FlgG